MAYDHWQRKKERKKKSRMSRTTMTTAMVDSLPFLWSFCVGANIGMLLLLLLHGMNKERSSLAMEADLKRERDEEEEEEEVVEEDEEEEEEKEEGNGRSTNPWILVARRVLFATAAIASTVQIECASESIIVHISTEGRTDFHGLVYPRGLSKNSSCLQEYRSQPSPITYNLPLRSCNTMPTELIH
ncbi:cuticlin-4 [Vespula maculifrons]|uniref:Cuticlin-4 n=1 Tax=Vespula maculifrons TaxID=7453 RepID=A0ABD2CY33_VESMC